MALTRRKTISLLFGSTLLAGTGGVLAREDFGGAPSGLRLERILASPYWQDGEFRNLYPLKPRPTEKSFARNMVDFLFRSNEGRKPSGVVPHVKTMLADVGQNELVWLGHSGYFLRVEGVSILIDPALTFAAPVPGVVKPFAGADVFSPSSLPAVDLLLITHDHYDHLDLRVINALKGRVGRVVTALGVGAHFERWGWPADLVTELEWWESVQPLPGVDLTFTPSLHFSGRSLKRNQTLWGGFMLDVKGWRGYFSGDGGIGPHFADVAERFPNIQFAALEDGQYNVDWADIHLMPDDWGRAARTLRADYTMPCHNAKYDLSVHRWIDPLNAAYDEARKNDVRLVLPRIGERLALADLSGHEAKWWPEKP